MKAIRIHNPGGPEALTLDEVPDPTPAAGQAVVKLAAAGVNYIDVYFRTGTYKAPLPLTIGLEGAGSMLQGLTAHYLVKSSYPLKKGDTCLVHAAAGGMGLLLCQMGKMLGATVIGTVSTDEKASLAKSAGADHVILYTKQDFEPEVKRLTNGRGVDVVYDGVGASTFDKSLSCLRPRGYMILFGAASGPVPALDLQT